jgi:hypothetical protein
MTDHKAYKLTKEQIRAIKMERGIFTKLFKYLEFKELIYSVPFAATSEEWDAWHTAIKKQHPIQYAIRELVENIEYKLTRKWYSLRYHVKTFFRPENEMIRKAVSKRHADITSIILDVNFAIILQFKKEADASCVDWQAHDSHAEFKKWLDAACVWISEGRANLEKEKDRAYPDISLSELLKPSSRKECNNLYKEVYRLEALIEQTDENVLTQMIKYRNYFWT